MKLYYYKGTCSLAVRIVINELGLKCDYESITELQVRDKKTEGGEDFHLINPKNSIPALILDDGKVLTEVSAILKYLADLKRDESIMPSSMNFNHYRVLEWLSYIASELHKSFIPNISPLVQGDCKAPFKILFTHHLKYTNKFLDGKQYLVGTSFTIADAYLFVVLSWLPFVRLQIADFPHLESYINNLKIRPSIVKSLEEEMR